MKNKLVIPLLFLTICLQGCIGNQESSKGTLIRMEGNKIVPNVIVEGNYMFSAGGTVEGPMYFWEGLTYCNWISPIEIGPQSLELKYSTSHGGQPRNKRIRAYGSLHIITPIGALQPNIYLEVDSLKTNY